MEVVFAKFGGMASFGGTSEQSAKVFCENFFPNLQKFSSPKVSRYTVVMFMVLQCNVHVLVCIINSYSGAICSCIG